MENQNQSSGSIEKDLKLTVRDRLIVAQVVRALRMLNSECPRRIERALDVFRGHYWAKPKFPVFRGFKHGRAARFYVNFLLALKIPEEHICIVLHSTDKRIIRRWRRILGHGHDQTSKKRHFIFVSHHPTNPRSKLALTYVGIEPLFPQQSASGKSALKAARGFSIAMALAARILYQIKTRALQKNSSGLEAEPPANSEGKGHRPCRWEMLSSFSHSGVNFGVSDGENEGQVDRNARSEPGETSAKVPRGVPGTASSSTCARSFPLSGASESIVQAWPAEDGAAPFPPTQLLKLCEVEDRTHMGQSNIYRLIALGLFPAPIHLGGTKWIAAEVDEYIQRKKDERDRQRGQNKFAPRPAILTGQGPALNGSFSGSKPGSPPVAPPSTIRILGPEMVEALRTVEDRYPGALSRSRGLERVAGRDQGRTLFAQPVKPDSKRKKR